MKAQSLEGQGFDIGYLMPWWEGRRVQFGRFSVWHYGIPEPTGEQLAESRQWVRACIDRAAQLDKMPIIPEELRLTMNDLLSLDGLSYR